jgi:hypothetical protein
MTPKKISWLIAEMMVMRTRLQTGLAFNFIPWGKLSNIGFQYWGRLFSWGHCGGALAGSSDASANSILSFHGGAIRVGWAP